jgi:hypothetical protein
MELAELSKVMHAARLVMDGSFGSQKHACTALNIPHASAGRVSDALTIITHGCPELIAAAESGRVPFQTAWFISRDVPYEEQISALQRIQMSGSKRGRHGLYAGVKPHKSHRHGNARDKLQKRVCEAVDKLLEAIGERADALAVCTNGSRPAPDAEQGRQWRKILRRSRKALSTLEHSIDWAKTEELANEKLQGAGENDASSNSSGTE